MNKPIYTLHKLPEGFIVTSDEEIKAGDTFYRDSGVVSVMNEELSDYYKSIRDSSTHNQYKLIAQQYQIDFSALSEADCKEIRWFDVEKLAKIHIETDYAEMGLDGTILLNSMDDYQKGFQKAQELLSDKMFTLEEVENAYKFGVASAQETHLPFDDYKQSLQTKSWEIEGYFENKKFVITCLKK